MMNTLTSAELAKNSSTILHRVHSGEKFLITESGEPLAFLIPPVENAHPLLMPSKLEIEAANQRLKSLILKGLLSGGLDNESIDRDLASEYSRESLP